MPFHINNVTSEVTFSEFEVTNDILSGLAEAFPYSGEVDVFEDDKLIDIGKINILYETYKDKKVIYKRHAENNRLDKGKEEKEKDEGKKENENSTKISRKSRTKTTPTPNYKLVNSSEPDLYVNKKFLS
jgi:hypothetical protein